ncbi:endonuclease V-like [Glandiceps talaboti]
MGCCVTKDERSDHCVEIHTNERQTESTNHEMSNKPAVQSGDDNKSTVMIDEEVRQRWEKEQNELKAKLITENTETWQSSKEFEGLEYVGGVDISFVKGDNVNACASLIVCSYPDLEVIHSDCTMVQLTSPYIPGFLAFREVKFLVDCIDKLRVEKPELLPQVILVDGNGLIHPREFGTACHLGVLSDIPCIGVAKKLFQVDGLEKNSRHLEKIRKLEKGGDTFPLVGNSGRVLGMALRSCNTSSNPVYVSIGHKINLDSSVKLVQCCCKYRIPEPVRQADIRSREFLRQNFKGSEKSTTGNVL